MPSIFTLEGPRLGATATEYPIYTVLPPAPPPPPPPKTFVQKLFLSRSGAARSMSGYPTYTSFSPLHPVYPERVPIAKLDTIAGATEAALGISTRDYLRSA